MPLLTTWLINHGVSRDSWLWFWGKVVTGATLFMSGVFDIKSWAAYLGIPFGDHGLHWLRAISIVVLALSGQYSTSKLFSAPAAKQAAEDRLGS